MLNEIFSKYRKNSNEDNNEEKDLKNEYNNDSQLEKEINNKNKNLKINKNEDFLNEKEMINTKKKVKK